MMCNFILIALTIIFSASKAVGIKQTTYDQGNPGLTLDQAEQIGESYITFMNHAGSSKRPVDQTEIDRLFYPKLTKVENVEKVLFMKSSELLAQIKKARESVGKWALKKLKIIPSSDTCVVYYTWKAENMPDQYTTMAILSLADEGKIKHIEEVYNKVSAGFGEG